MKFGVHLQWTVRHDHLFGRDLSTGSAWSIDSLSTNECLRECQESVRVSLLLMIEVRCQHWWQIPLEYGIVQMRWLIYEMHRVCKATIFFLELGHHRYRTVNQTEARKETFFVCIMFTFYSLLCCSIEIHSLLSIRDKLNSSQRIVVSIEKSKWWVDGNDIYSFQEMINQQFTACRRVHWELFYALLFLFFSLLWMPCRQRFLWKNNNKKQDSWILIIRLS